MTTQQSNASSKPVIDLQTVSSSVLLKPEVQEIDRKCSTGVLLRDGSSQIAIDDNKTQRSIIGTDFSKTQIPSAVSVLLQ